MKDFDLNVPVLDGRKFSWSGTAVPSGGFTYQGVAEASDFGRLEGRSLFGRCWTDACDRGCIVVNDKRETSMKFVVDHIEEDEGDLKFWSLTNGESDPSKRINLIIYND